MALACSGWGSLKLVLGWLTVCGQVNYLAM